MWNIGLDVHQRETQVCILTPAGSVTEQRLPTTRARLTGYFGPLAPSQVLLESSTESEWVAQCLEALGHTVLVADPSFAPMYGRRRRTKTDRRDARALAEACASGVYRLAHRLSAHQREVRGALAVRQSLVRTRTRWINYIRGRLRGEGLRLARGTPTTFARRVQALALPAPLAGQLAPLLTLLPTLTAAIAAADQQLATWAGQDPIAATLQSVPGVGPLTALAFIATLDDVTRFPTAREVPAYLGLVPRERSSGEMVRRGGISKAGQCPGPVALGRSRVACAALAGRESHPAPRVGRARGPAARAPDRRRGGGPAAGADSLCAVARRRGVRRPTDAARRVATAAPEVASDGKRVSSRGRS